MLYLALSCLQGRPLDRAAAELLSLLPGELGLQLTPGCAPGPVPEHVATRTHHGWVPHALRARVWSDGALVWRGHSVHPPTTQEVGPGWAPPDDATLADWVADGVCRCPDDCLVRAEGVCAHGLASWKLVLDALALEDALTHRRPEA